MTTTALNTINNSKQLNTRTSSDVAFKQPLPRKRQRVLDEDTYLDTMGAIIERDFFPDLPKLRARMELLASAASSTSGSRSVAPSPSGLEKLKSVDLELRRESMRRPSSSRSQTPSLSSMTRDGGELSTPRTVRGNEEEEEEFINNNIENNDNNTQTNMANMRLDSFLANHTSEDNESFEKILESTNQRRREKYKWIYDQEAEARKKQLLALTNANSALVEEAKNKLLLTQSKGVSSSSSSTKELSNTSIVNTIIESKEDTEKALQLLDNSGKEEKETLSSSTLQSSSTLSDEVVTRELTSHGVVPYSAANALMFPPTGVPLSAAEEIERAKGAPKEISHSNTRLEVNPFAGTLRIGQTKPVILDAERELFAQRQALKQRTGQSFTPQMGGESPQVNGYGFVATPSPAPGRDDEGTPFVTWGSIDSTPLLINALTDVPLDLTPGPSFEMPRKSKREEIAQELSEQASRELRKRQQGAEGGKRMRTPMVRMSPRYTDGGRTPMRPGTGVPMSPAASRLLSNAMKRNPIGSDLQLRASYQTPSSTPRTYTPSRSSKVIPSPSPSLRSHTPLASPIPSRSSLQASGRAQTPISKPVSASSLTDDLLHI